MKEIDFLGLFRKYKWYIIGYAIWVCFFSFVIPHKYSWSRSDWWSLWGIWNIMFPLIGYCVVSAVNHYRNK